jgi:5-amino-6-(5-phosphoribosylamino)uracil reductase
LIRSPQLLEQRRSEGRAEQPAAVVVSRSPDFPSTWRFFDQPLQRWLLAPEPVDQGFDRWFPLASTWPDRLKALGAAGIQRLVLLGGAQLSADLLQADCVDALQLTLVPQLLGGRFSWLPCTDVPLPAALAQPGAWQSDGAEDLGDGEWLVRYRRIRSG